MDLEAAREAGRPIRRVRGWIGRAIGTISPRWYFGIFAALSGAILAPLGAAALFLWQSGELMAPSAVASWLQRTGGLYGTALNSNAREVALSIYLLREPKVAALTSSRGTEWRQPFFTEPFACACMMMSDLEEGLLFLDAVEDRHLPEVMIVGLDFWWFSRTPDHRTQPLPTRDAPGAVTWDGVRSVAGWLSEGKVTLSGFLGVLVGIQDASPLTDEPKRGIQAIVKSFGTRADGSWAVHSVAADMDLHPIYGEFTRTLRDPSVLLEHKEGRYAPGQDLDPGQLDRLRRLVARLEARGVGVVLVLLPLAPPIADFIETDPRYAWVGRLREALGALGHEYYDFLDPRDLDATVCEFQDTHHGGNALYARMLRRILADNPDTLLRGYVDETVVEDVATRFKGRVVATLGGETPAFREVDFLDMGCGKS